MKRMLLIGVVVGVFISHTAFATTINWTDWQSANPNGTTDTVVGNIGGVTVTYSGDYKFTQLGTGINYWTEPAVGLEPYTGSAVIDNAPTPSEMIALNLSAQHTITFSEAVLNPVMAIVSMGDPNKPVSYIFNQPFDLLSNGVGYWSWANGGAPGSLTISGNTLTGSELHAAIQFSGLVTSISWESTPSEDWQGITVGAPVPEPATMLLFGAGIIGLAGVVRKRKK